MRIIKSRSIAVRVILFFMSVRYGLLVGIGFDMLGGGIKRSLTDNSFPGVYGHNPLFHGDFLAWGAFGQININQVAKSV